MTKEKLGIFANYLDSRNDLRDFLQELKEHYDLVVFLREGDLKVGEQLDGIEVRPIKVHIPRSFRNLFTHYMYRVFGKLPKTKWNYYLSEKVANSNPRISGKLRKERNFILFISRIMPKIMSYDSFLNWLRFKKDTDISGIDKFLCFTHIYDELFYAQLLKSGKKVYTYIYSWDHPCKMKAFSKRPVKYLMWNQGLKDDVVELHGIPENKVKIVGSTQLAYIYEYLNENRNVTAEKDFVYFGFASGYPNLVRDENKYVEHISEAIKEISPSTKVVVRPYPFLDLWNIYEKLNELENVEVEDYTRTKITKNYGLHRDEIKEKFDKLNKCRAFIHIGTTLGFECAYFDSPVILADYDIPSENKLRMSHLIGQYHNKKYLKLEGFENVIRDPKDWKSVLKKLFETPKELMNYNNAIADSTGLSSFKEVASKFAEELKDE